MADGHHFENRYIDYLLFRAAVSAIVSLAVLLTVYFVQLLSFYCKFEQIKIDWLIDLSEKSSDFYDVIKKRKSCIWTDSEFDRTYFLF